MGWIGTVIAIGVQAEQAYFAKNEKSLGRYFTIGGHLGFLQDALAGKPPEGQRLGDLQLQETAEGSSINRCFGPENRVAGTLVWMSDLREVKKTESGGGKGGSGGEFITYTYFAHVLLKFCRAEEPISRFQRVWADGKDFYDNVTPTATATSNEFVTALESSVIYNGTVSLTRNYIKISIPSAGPGESLRFFKSGVRATVSGYTAGLTLTQFLLTATPTDGANTISLRSTSGGTQTLAPGNVIEFQGYRQTYTVRGPGNTNVLTTATTVPIEGTVSGATKPTTGAAGLATTVKQGVNVNNGSFLVVDADDATHNNYHTNPPSFIKLTDETNPYRLFVTAIAGPTITLTQANATFKESRVKEIHFLLGGPDQRLPQIVQDVEKEFPEGQLYGARNYACILLQDLNLTDSGNRIANFESLVEVTQDKQKVSEVITTVLSKDANIPPTQVDVSLVSGVLRGYTIHGPQPPKRSLLPIMTAFDVVAWERGGVIHFANRSLLEELTIPVAELGAKAPADETRNSPLSVLDPSRDHRPSEIIVSYRSSSSDYQTASKRARRTEELPVHVENVDFGSLVMDDDQAQQVADRLLAVEWGAQRQLSCSLPQSRAGQVREGMVLSFGPIYGQNWKFLVDRVDRGANMLVVASGREYDPELLEQEGTTEGTLGMSNTGNSQDGGRTLPAPAAMVLLDVPPLSDQHRSEPGIYVAAHSSDAHRPWRGAVLYWSTDAGLTWKRVGDVPGEAVVGTLVTPPTATVDPALWDRANVIRIKVYHPQVELGSVTEDECLAGRNRFSIGKELVGAAHVEFVEQDELDGSRTYDLSVLLRGQHDTDHHLDDHVADEQVVWLDGPGLQFLPLSFSHVDKVRLWRLVPQGGFLEDAIELELTPVARNCKPFHVRDIQVSRDGSNNITWTWERASRAARTFLEQGEPLDEEVEQYEIDVVLAGAVVRTITVTGARTGGYTAAQGLTDGVNTSNPVTARFYQISQSFRRGQETEVTI